MRLLVTGGAGYIGRVMISYLSDQGIDVTIFDQSLYDASLPFIRGDIRDRGSLCRAMKGMHAVVHLAAVVGEPACLVDPDAAHAINTTGTEIALFAAQECSVSHFIFISTCSNYGVSLPNTLTCEEAPLQPLSIYAETKVMAERAVSNAPMATTILRFGTICGLSPKMRFDVLVNELARSAALATPIKIFAPSAWRPFLHIQDAARAVVFCLRKPQRQIFNVISENYQKGQLAELVQKHFPECAVEMRDQSSDQRDYRVSSDRIKQELGFTPAHTVEQALLEVADAVKQGIFPDPCWSGYAAVPIPGEHFASSH